MYSNLVALTNAAQHAGGALPATRCSRVQRALVAIKHEEQIVNKIYRFLILAALVIAALGSYSYGSATGVFVFIILGFVFEGLFWFGLFRKNPKSSS